MYESHVDYLNLEYIFARAYEFVANFHWTLGAVPSGIASLLTIIAIVGMSISLLLLLFIVYAQIRLLQVEHAGFHAKEAAVHEAHEAREQKPPVHEERWERIEALMASQNHGDWRRGILEADIMLGMALNTAGYVGESVGEQLKLANPLQIPSLRGAWDAHMLRNKIAHQGEAYELTQREAQTARDKYKRVFEELGAI